MYKILVTAILSLFFFTGYCNASDPDLFKLDEQALDIKFAELTFLENYVVSNQGITLTEILNNNKNIINFLPYLSTGSPALTDVMFTLDDGDAGVLVGTLCCCLLGCGMLAL